MNHVQAIQKLIERNKKLVEKTGVTNYTQETDTIINALLDYIHGVDARINTLTNQNENAKTICILLGIEDYLNFDVEFMNRYRHNVYVSAQQAYEIDCGIIDKEDVETNIYAIKESHRIYKMLVEAELCIFNFLKELNHEQLKAFKTIFPDYTNPVVNKYYEKDILDMIKRKILLNYE